MMNIPPTPTDNLECKIPNEIMYLIFDLLADNPSVLYKLLTLHRFFRPTIERMLYGERVHFEDRATHLGFLTTVASNPRIAAYTRHYDLRTTNEFGGWKNVDAHQVAAAVKEMVNLKHFHVDMWMYGLFDTEELFQALKNKRLESFEWSTWCKKEEIMDLLVTQPDLVRLSTQFIDAPERLGASHCRKLRYLNGDRAVMSAIMPGRNVEVLVWTPLMFEGDIPVSTELVPAINRLRALLYDGKRSNTIRIQLISGLGTSLEVLQVTYNNASKNGFSEAIERMTNLKTLIIVCSNLDQELLIRAQKSLFPIATACPSLESIYICLSIGESTVIPPGHPNEHWRIKRGTADAVPLVVSVDLLGTEKGDIFHRIVNEMFRDPPLACQYLH